jgi:hypothetical protein
VSLWAHVAVTSIQNICIGLLCHNFHSKYSCGITLRSISQLLHHYTFFNRDSSDNVGTDYWNDGPGSIPGSARFVFLHSVQTDSWTRPAYLVVTGGSLSVTKRPGRKTDHSSPSSAKVKEGGALLHVFME